jgi:tyrosyl-tRNA synthetase
MSLPDQLMESYYQLLTDLPMDEIRLQIAAKPRDAKIRLAKEIITWLHSREAADAAEAEFVKVFSKGEVPDEMPEFAVGAGPHRVKHLLAQTKLAASNGEASRKIKEGAVSVDGEKVTDPQKEVTIDQPTVLKLGRKFARVKP